MQPGRANSPASVWAWILSLVALFACTFAFGSAAWAEDEPAAAAEPQAAAEGEAAEADEDEDAQVYRALTTQQTEIESGILMNFVDGDPSAFAQYRGLEDDEHLYPLANVDLFRRSPWDGESTQYYRLQAYNLGFESRFVGAEYGHQGLFGLSFLYDELPVYKTRTAQTFFQGVGTTDLTLPPGWVAGGRADTPIPGAPGYPTAFQSSIIDNLDVTHIGWQRRKLGGGFTMVLPADLEFVASYSYETKQGEKLIGSTFGTNGGNPRAVIHPERIDYHTQQIDGALRYAGDVFQLELGYFGSIFNDDERAQTWLNPYTAVGSWDPSAGFQGPPGGVVAGCAGVPQCGMGQRSLPPDNLFNQLVAAGGVDLPYQTRVTLRSAFGWSTQNERFLPYTINPVLTAVTQGGAPTTGDDLAALPRSSLDGEIFTSIVDFAVASRPIEDLRLDARYRFENRDNDTPRDLDVYIPSDTADQGPADGSTARINMPYGWTRHEATFDAGYSLPYRSELALGYEWEMTERNYQEVDELTAHTLNARVHSRPTRYVQTRINYEHVWRNGNGYDGSNPFIKSHTPEFIEDELDDFAAPGSSCALAGLTPEECLWENHPLLRKFYLADLERDRLGALATVLPHQDLTATFSLNWWHDQYDDSELGLTDAKHLSPGIDLTWMAHERLSTYAFYNYERRVSDSTGHEFANVQEALDLTRRWTSKEKVHTHTVGGGFDFDVILDRLGLGADYLYAWSNGDIVTVRAAGSTLPAPAPFPDLLSRQHNLSVHADYRFTENLSMRLAYLFQDLETNDWAYDDLTPTSLTCAPNACVIGTGQESPHYTAHGVAWSVIFRFW
jgi:MtrB/PioB family decaheme-associated outer membrane protein